ncbi:HdeD family acid-resistance protein [Peptostreptococcus canis]|uniref:DUF308 domain-containing protein n=1 Tax=Peptostreptococcus canis TaxID=1159213 RepID=A0ABR6TKI0_9FIRM|nr:DUF308 domain-containing protein [Peptostreptococcus canis]MBC2575909.1 hypothetical protein [Peptostreptococcus canis]MBP1997970.1 uncharacterized membrane protein HdeD (DUF308 family) [Peptostreptococcus canis]
MKNKSYIDLLIGILLIIASVFTFIKPIGTFLILSYSIGALCLIKGLHFIYLYFNLKEYFKIRANTALVLGIVLIILGFIFVVKPLFANKIFAYIIAIWFIYDAMNNFLELNILKTIDIKLYILGLITNIIIVVGSVCIFINPWITAISLSVALGVTFLVSGISYIVFSITNRRDNKKKMPSRKLK